MAKTKTKKSDLADYSEIFKRMMQSLDRNTGAIDAIVKSYDFFGEADSDEIQTAIEQLTIEQEDLRLELETVITEFIDEKDKLCEDVNELRETVGRLEGWAAIKIDSLAQREKLEAFVASEIWPNHNENANYIIP